MIHRCVKGHVRPGSLLRKVRGAVPKFYPLIDDLNQIGEIVEADLAMVVGFHPNPKLKRYAFVMTIGKETHLGWTWLERYERVKL